MQPGLQSRVCGGALPAASHLLQPILSSFCFALRAPAELGKVGTWTEEEHVGLVVHASGAVCAWNTRKGAPVEAAGVMPRRQRSARPPRPAAAAPAPAGRAQQRLEQRERTRQELAGSQDAYAVAALEAGMVAAAAEGEAAQAAEARQLVSVAFDPPAKPPLMLYSSIFQVWS